MKPPAIPRPRRTGLPRHSRQRERGITMVLVAIAMVAIIAMAALSIDVITLYLAREEAQRSADESALAAARVISLSGITGDPGNVSGQWVTICGPAGTATLAATAVATQSAVGGTVATTVNVTYSYGTGAQTSDCSTLIPGPFGVNPQVNVQSRDPACPLFSRASGEIPETRKRVSHGGSFQSFGLRRRPR
jgi:Flp pilus assembly protein TadG